MVFLNQECVVKAKPVVMAATARYCVFLCQSQARQGFTSVQQTAMGMGDQIRIFAANGGGTGQGLEEIQRRAFGGQ